MNAVFYGSTLVSLMFSITNENDGTTTAQGTGYLILARTFCDRGFVTPNVYLKNIVPELRVFLSANPKALRH